jgi:hypothetical protein
MCGGRVTNSRRVCGLGGVSRPSHLGNRLAEVGDERAALDPTREATEIYRRLADAEPAAHLPDLAMALWAYAWVRAASRVDEGWHEAYEFYAVTRDLAHPDGTVAQISRAFRGFGLAPLTHVLGNVGGGYPAVRQSARRLLREIAGDYRAHADACLQRRMSWSALTGLVLYTRALFPLDVPRRCAAEEGTWLAGQFFAPGELALPSLAAAAADLAWSSPAGDIAFSSGRHRCPWRACG